MGNQESMFSPQENTPYQPGNTDPREQQPRRQQVGPGANQGPYEAGYSRNAPDMDTGWNSSEKLRPIQPQSIPTWQLVAGIILLFVVASVVWSLISFIFSSIFFILGLVLAVIAVSQLSVKRIPLPSQVFTMSQQPRLIIRNPTGSIRIHRGTSDRVEIKATKFVNGWFGGGNEGAVDFAQDGGAISVTSRSNYQWAPLGGLRNVDLDITTPEFSDVQIEGNAGTIKIEGINGQARVNTSAGTIDVLQATLHEQSNLTTNAGTINVRQATLKGQARFDTNAGTIHFDGSIDPQGDYRFNTNAGTIDVILSGNPSFTLKASTDLGSVTNQFGSTTVGPAPHAHLELSTNLGTISVRRK